MRHAAWVGGVRDVVSRCSTGDSGLGSRGFVRSRVTITVANAAAVPPTTGIAAAAADEVSAQIAALFATHAQQ
jgi:PE family